MKRRNSVQVFVKTVVFPRFMRRAHSQLFYAPKVYVQCMKKDVCAGKMWSTDGRVILWKCNLMKTRCILPLLRVLFRARLVYHQRRTEEKERRWKPISAGNSLAVNAWKWSRYDPQTDGEIELSDSTTILGGLLQTPLISSSSSSSGEGERVINGAARAQQRADRSILWRVWV